MNLLFQADLSVLIRPDFPERNLGELEMDYIGLMQENNRVDLRPQSPGKKAAATKGRIERVREAKMAAWTRKNGKNDAVNPHSKQNSQH